MDRKRETGSFFTLQWEDKHTESYSPISSGGICPEELCRVLQRKVVLVQGPEGGGVCYGYKSGPVKGMNEKERREEKECITIPKSANGLIDLHLFPWLLGSQLRPRVWGRQSWRVSGFHPVHLFLLLLEKLKTKRLSQFASRLHKELEVLLWVDAAPIWLPSQHTEPCP